MNTKEAALLPHETLKSLSQEDRGHLLVLLRAFTVMELWVAITEKETRRLLDELGSDKEITERDVQNQVALFL